LIGTLLQDDWQTFSEEIETNGSLRDLAVAILRAPAICSRVSIDGKSSSMGFNVASTDSNDGLATASFRPFLKSRSARS
jgi:hypothetical protein